MQRYTEAFDVEGTKKKIRNFVRKVVREHPEMLERWNSIMDKDVDSHGDYEELELIHDMFKPYGGKQEIQFEKELNQFTFIIPLFSEECYSDYDERHEVREEIGEEAKAFFGAEVEAFSKQVWRDKYCFAFKVTYGNAYMTPKRVIQTAMKERFKVFGTPITSFDTYITQQNPKNYREYIKIPMKKYIYEQLPRYDSGYPIHTLLGYAIEDRGEKKGRDYRFIVHYFQGGLHLEIVFEKNDTSTTFYNKIIDQLGDDD